jgi:hypothetical protein
MQYDVELSELRAAALARAQTDSALEAKACALMRQYGLFLPRPAKDFFRELADHLNWQHLKGQLK